MNARKRLFTFLFAALAMLLCTACGKWDYSREAMKAANEAQGETLRVEFKVNQTFTNALRAASEDNIQPNNVDKAMTMDKSIAKLLTSGYRLDVYALRADVDADQAAAQLADEFINRLAGCEDEGFISMVKADNSYFYMAVLTYKHDSGNGGSGNSEDEGNDGNLERDLITWDGTTFTLTVWPGAGDVMGSELNENAVRDVLINQGDIQSSDDFTLLNVENLVVQYESGIESIGKQAFYAGRIGSPQNSTLKSVKLYGVKLIAEEAFYFCADLYDVVMPDVTQIDSDGFHLCKKITSLNLPNVEIIGARAFEDCEKLAGTLYLPKSTTINDTAFFRCNLETIILPSIKKIGASVFDRCVNLKKVWLGDELDTIGEDTFPQNTSSNPYDPYKYPGGNITVYYGQTKGSFKENIMGMSMVKVQWVPARDLSTPDQRMSFISLRNWEHIKATYNCEPYGNPPV